MEKSGVTKRAVETVIIGEESPDNNNEHLVILQLINTFVIDVLVIPDIMDIGSLSVSSVRIIIDIDHV